VSNAPQMKRILLVDDEAHVLRVMKLSLDRNGYEVDTALSGDVALQMMYENDYHAIITDIDLSQMSGRQLCETVRDRHGESILIFVVSGKREFDSPGNSDQDAVTSETLAWKDSMVNIEALEKPVSLRWIVARLNEFFGAYDQPGNF